MDNLIATTLAIALIAIVTAMGLNYGAEAILSYQAKIEATKIVSDAQRIAAAWKSYARANNGDPTLSTTPTDYNCWGSNGALDLVPNYISALPNPPSGAADNTVNYYYPALVGNYGVNGAGTKVGPSKTPADSIALQIKSPRVCSALSVLGGYPYPSAIPALTGNLNLLGTSATSNTITVASKTFTTQTGLIIPTSEAISAVSSANSANYVTGTVTSYNTSTGALVIAVTAIGGSGTVASWNIIPAWQPFNCVYVDNDASGGPSQGDTMLFVYKVFDQNNFSSVARTACP